MAEFTEMIQRDYGIKKSPIFTRNHQSNVILERVHQTIGSMIKSFQVHNTNLGKEDPCTRILGVVIFAAPDTVHETNHVTPMQFVFGRNTMLNDKHEDDWQ